MSARDIKTYIEAARERYYRLILVVGPSGSGKTKLLLGLSADEGCPYINLGLALSERLLELPARTRTLRTSDIVSGLVEGTGSDTVLLDNTEILFEPSLHQDPLRLLQRLSRNLTIVASWNGRFEDKVLTYGQPGHPEAKSYHDVDALVYPLS